MSETALALLPWVLVVVIFATWAIWATKVAFRALGHADEAIDEMVKAHNEAVQLRRELATYQKSAEEEIRREHVDSDQES